MVSKLHTTVLQQSHARTALTNAAALLMLAAVGTFGAGTASASDRPDAADTPYPDMPHIAPIGVRISSTLSG
jgi:hypothetical protein